MGIRVPFDFGGGDLLARKNYTMQMCTCWNRTHIAWKTNETAIIPNIVILNACILNGLYQQPQFLHEKLHNFVAASPASVLLQLLRTRMCLL